MLDAPREAGAVLTVHAHAYAAARVWILAVFLAELVSARPLVAGAPQADVLVDPEVRAQISTGRARVFVMLQMPETDDQAQRSAAIGRAQDSVLARLPQSNASLVRRYASVPMLALEIDAAALQALEAMTDVVTGVKLDRPVRPQ
jgi:hypothetical protein